MRIVVEHGGQDHLNLGDLAMLQVCVRRLRQMWPESEIEVFTANIERLAANCPGTIPIMGSSRRLYSRPGSLFGPAGRALPRVESRLRAVNSNVALRILAANGRIRKTDSRSARSYVQSVESADLVVAAGGGYFADDFPHMVQDIHCTVSIANERGIPCVLMGQGLGPLEDRRVAEMTREVLRAASFIGLREGQDSVDILKRFGIDASKTIVTGDDAIEPAYRERRPHLGAAIGLNLRLAYFAETDQSSVDATVEAMRLLRQHVDAPFVSVPISRFTESDDASAILQLTTALDSAADDARIPSTPGEVIEQVGRCRMVITGSYHAAVFALSQGIPAVALAKSRYYFSKFSGLAAQFPGGCAIVDMNGPDYKVNLVEKALSAWAGADSSRSTLLGAAQAQIRLVEDAYRRVFEIVGAGQ